MYWVCYSTLLSIEQLAWGVLVWSVEGRTRCRHAARPAAQGAGSWRREGGRRWRAALSSATPAYRRIPFYSLLCLILESPCAPSSHRIPFYRIVRVVAMAWLALPQTRVGGRQGR